MSFKAKHRNRFTLINLAGICLMLLAISDAQSAPNWPEIELQKELSVTNLPLITIDIDKDPVYQTSKRYRAFPLKPLIEKLSTNFNGDKKQAVLVFTAKDGYKVAMAYADAIAEPGYIAFHDMAATQGNWTRFKFGNKTATPAPYYLVWRKPNIDKWRYPWPFQLTGIAMKPASVYFGKAAPVSSTDKIDAGFAEFSRFCIRCHAVNGSGGTLGPDLNSPQNIAELYNNKTLKGLILNNPTYRPNSKMPVFDNILNETQIDQIMAYLKAMRTSR